MWRRMARAPEGNAYAVTDAIDTANEMLSDLDYPVFVVTAASSDEKSGCLVGFASQCSIEPLRVMVWLSKANHTFRVARQADILAVHALAAGQHQLAALFGEETGDEVDKFDRCPWRPGPDGVPIIEECSRWLAGRVLERVDGGDHVGFLLETVEAAAGAWSVQLSFRQVRDLRPGHPASTH